MSAIDTLKYGNSLSQERARKILPILIKRAKSSKTIYYSDLANEIEMKFPLNLRYSLDCIGQAIKELGKGKIPFINSLVVNKSKGLPGNGFSEFIPEYADLDDFGKKNFLDTELLPQVFKYPDWDLVIDKLDLKD